MSHKSYQSTLPCSNKLLQKRWDDTYYQEHRKMVHTAKPMVDTKAPTVRPHITSKWKKQQIERERADDIERDNSTLLKKMQHIMHTQGSVDHRNAYRHHSLNDLKRQRELERVAKENKEMLGRLQKVEPMYKVSDWIDDWRKKEDLTERITAFPEGPLQPKSKTLPLDRAATAPQSKRLAKTTAPSGRSYEGRLPHTTTAPGGRREGRSSEGRLPHTTKSKAGRKPGEGGELKVAGEVSSSVTKEQEQGTAKTQETSLPTESPEQQ